MALSSSSRPSNRDVTEDITSDGLDSSEVELGGSPAAVDPVRVEEEVVVAPSSFRFVFANDIKGGQQTRGER